MISATAAEKRAYEKELRAMEHQLSPEEFLEWNVRNPGPVPRIKDLVNNARESALEYLRRAGYDAPAVGMNQAGVSIFEPQRKRDTRIKGSLGGYEATLAGRVLSSCAGFDAAWKGERWEVAAICAFHAGMNEAAMQANQTPAKRSSKGAAKGTGKRNSRIAEFLKTAKVAEQTLRKKSTLRPSKKTVHNETERLLAGRNVSMQYSAFAARFELDAK